MAITVAFLGTLLVSVPSANADTIISSVPGVVPTTYVELIGGFLVPQFRAVPANPAVSSLFYGHDQGAAQPSQPNWFTTQWHDLPPISPNAPDGSAILSNVQMATPQLSIDQFEGFTIPGQAYLLFGNPSLPNPLPVSEPDLGYPLIWQFTGQGSLAQCDAMAANVVGQAINDYSGSNPFRLAAENVPSLYYSGGGSSADPGQSVTFTATQSVTFSQQVSSTVTSPQGVFGMQGNFLPTVGGTGTLGVQEEETTATAYTYNNTSKDEQYYWLSTQADYYTTIGVPYVFYKPATGPVMAEYPNGEGPLINPGTLPANWTGNLGSWQLAQSDPGISDSLLSFPWLPAGTCYVGQSLSLARVLHPNVLGLHLIAEQPFGTDS